VTVQHCTAEELDPAGFDAGVPSGLVPLGPSLPSVFCFFVAVVRIFTTTPPGVSEGGMVTLSVVSRRNAFDDVVSLFSPRTVGM
jgi:hypothetical protein